MKTTHDGGTSLRDWSEAEAVIAALSPLGYGRGKLTIALNALGVRISPMTTRKLMLKQKQRT